jgi:hypothetical protein
MGSRETRRKEWRVSVRNSAGRNVFKDLDLDGRDVYKWIVKNYNGLT